MKKFWMLMSFGSSQRFDLTTAESGGFSNYGPFSSYEEAEENMKRRAAASQKAGNNHTHVIVEAVATAKVPVPAIDVEKIK